MKKILFFIQGLIVYLLLPFSVFAKDTDISPCVNTDGISKALCSLAGTDNANVAATIRNVVVLFVVLAVIIALLYLLYGGIKWITSRGEKTEVEAARNHIIAAIVGLVVVFLAVFIVSVILAAFGLTLDDIKIPQIVP